MTGTRGPAAASVATQLEDTRRAFDSVSADYDGPRGNNELIQRMRRTLWDTVDREVAPGARLLDLGCGTGIDALRFAQRGYRVGAGEPFHGYRFKVLTSQGPTAPGGAVDYVVKGNMIGGFGLVAYPAEYGNSGIMTFIINNDGDIYQKDLGARTARLAARMSSFSPDHTWKKVVDVEK